MSAHSFVDAVARASSSAPVRAPPSHAAVLVRTTHGTLRNLKFRSALNEDDANQLLPAKPPTYTSRRLPPWIVGRHSGAVASAVDVCAFARHHGFPRHALSAKHPKSVITAPRA